MTNEKDKFEKKKEERRPKYQIYQAKVWKGATFIFLMFVPLHHMVHTLIL